MIMLREATSSPQTITAAGIDSSEAIGSAVVSPGAVTIAAAGVGTSEAVGAASITPGAVTLAAAGIGSSESVGTSAITPGAVAIAASALLQAWRRLVDDRIGRVRDEQRAAMAAHLHDSVLQTLALIQNRSEASSEVSRIARAQERELRAWLYDGDSPADSDLPTDLRDYAGALELDFPVRIDVVSTGSSAERASGELAAAAREAMLNAARHAGGDVSVYIEGAASAVDVFIRDRGDGFDPAAVPADRWGVRESIIGRMRRVGGSGAIARPSASASGASGAGTTPGRASALSRARLPLSRAQSSPVTTSRPSEPACRTSSSRTSESTSLT